MGFTWRARTLVPPRENLGGSYPMLNSIVSVRPLRPSAKLDIIGQEGEPSYSYYYGGSNALPRAQLWSHRSLLCWLLFNA